MHPLHPLTFLPVLLSQLLTLSPLTRPRFLQWNGGGLRARSAELFHSIALHFVDFICIRKSNPSLPLFRSLDTLLCNLIALTYILSPDNPHASGIVIIFVRQGLSIYKLFASSLSSLDPYPEYAGVNISLNHSSSLSFLNVYAPTIRSSSTDSRTDSFTPHSSVLQNIFILRDFNCNHPSGTQEVPLTPMGRKYSIG